MELEQLNGNTQESTRSSDSGPSQTGPWSPEFPSPLSSGAPLTLQAMNCDESTNLSDTDRFTVESSSSSDNCHNSDSGSTSCTDLCHQRLSQLDRSSLEKTNNVSSLNFSQPSVGVSESEMVRSDAETEDSGVSATRCTLDGEEVGSSPSADFAHQTRDSIDVRWDSEEDQRSMVSRRTVREGMCCCYQTFHRAFLQCVEETPAMVSGLVLSLAFCISIIVLIPTTGRVRPVCACLHRCMCVSKKPILCGF